MTTRSVAVCATFALAAGLAACGSSSSGGSSGGGGSSSSGGKGKLPATIPVTFVGDLTGPVAYVGRQEQLGMNLAIREVNDSGELGSSRLKLSFLDTGSDQNTAATQMSAAAKSSAVAVFGPLLSNEALATAPIAQRAKLPDIATQSQNDGTLQAGNYIYRLTTSQLKYDNLLVNYVARRGARSVNLIYANDNPTLVDVSTKLLPAGFKQLGIPVNQNVGIPTATTDFSSLTSKLTAGNPGAIGLMLVGAPIPALVKALRTAGYRGLIFADSAATAGTLVPAGAAADGVIYALDYTQQLDYPSSKAFTALYKKANPSLVPYGYNGSGYDAVRFLARAIRASGDASRDGVLKGMQMVASSGGFDGAAGPTRFTTPDNRDIATPGVVVEWQGREVMVTRGDPSKLVQPVVKP